MVDSGGSGGLCPSLPSPLGVEEMRRRNRWKGDNAGVRSEGAKREAVAAEIPRLRRYARALMRDPVAADDLVQDCLERALTRLHLFEDGTNLRAWLFTIMHRAFVNTVRRDARRASSPPLDPEAEPRSTGPEQGRGLELRDLSNALDRLPAEQREALLLVALEGLTYRETADATGVAIGTVMSRLARARARLRELMEGGASGEGDGEGVP